MAAPFRIEGGLSARPNLPFGQSPMDVDAELAQASQGYESWRDRPFGPEEPFRPYRPDPTLRSTVLERAKQGGTAGLLAGPPGALLGAGVGALAGGAEYLTGDRMVGDTLEMMNPEAAALKVAGSVPSLLAMQRMGARHGDDVSRGMMSDILSGQQQLDPSKSRYVSEPAEYGTPGIEYWTSRGGDSGFTTRVDPDDGLVDVGALYNLGRERGAADEAMMTAVDVAQKQGVDGVKLDAFDADDGALLAHYKSLGFEEVPGSRSPYNPKYDPDKLWIDQKPDVVYMRMSDEAFEGYADRLQTPLTQDPGRRIIDPPGISDEVMARARGAREAGSTGPLDPLAQAGPLSQPRSGRYLEEDLGVLSQVPDVPQRELKRGELPNLTDPLQERVEQLYSPHNIETVQQGMERGAEMGGAAWYNLEPIRANAVDVLGPEKGEAAFKRLGLLLAASSPRSTVKQNIRRASLGHHLAEQGRPFPAKASTEFPGYGHLAQKIQQPHLLRAQEGLAPSGVHQPKIASFGENLAGNQAPGTIDTHNAIQSGWIKPGQTLNASHYPLLEDFNAEMGSMQGLTPAQAQASLWMGMGDVSGVEDVRVFMNQFNDTIERTAQRMGKSPDEVMKGFWRGEWPLYGVAGAVTLDQVMQDDTEGEL